MSMYILDFNILKEPRTLYYYIQSLNKILRLYWFSLLFLGSKKLFCDFKVKL